MNSLFFKLALCVEKGKVDMNSPHPAELRGEEGAVELTVKALSMTIPPGEILKKGLMPGMNRIGEKFSAGEAFIPDLLISARAMKAAMRILKPKFDSGEAYHRGKIILGTVAGDIHEIGKNVVKMVLEGEGWQVIDLGVDVTTAKFQEALEENPDSIVGISALLTTTMLNMENSVGELKAASPHTRIFVGGAPVSQAFNDKIGADGYFPEPYSFAKYLAMNQ